MAPRCEGTKPCLPCMWTDTAWKPVMGACRKACSLAPVQGCGRWRGVPVVLVDVQEGEQIMSDNDKWLAGLKAGDLVVVRSSGYKIEYWIRRIKRIDSEFIYIGSGQPFRRKSGTTYRTNQIGFYWLTKPVAVKEKGERTMTPKEAVDALSNDLDASDRNVLGFLFDAVAAMAKKNETLRCVAGIRETAKSNEVLVRELHRYAQETGRPWKTNEYYAEKMVDILNGLADDILRTSGLKVGG